VKEPIPFTALVKMWTTAKNHGDESPEVLNVTVGLMGQTWITFVAGIAEIGGSLHDDGVE
jgi:hypothetical protein